MFARQRNQRRDGVLLRCPLSQTSGVPYVDGKGARFPSAHTRCAILVLTAQNQTLTYGSVDTVHSVALRATAPTLLHLSGQVLADRVTN